MVQVVLGDLSEAVIRNTPACRDRAEERHNLIRSLRATE
jgi:hypothetical protein